MDRWVAQLQDGGIDGAEEEAGGGDLEANILPLGATAVFVRACHALGVAVHVCPEEADRPIAALAAAHRCAVLTNDTDFLIYSGDLTGAVFLARLAFSDDPATACAGRLFERRMVAAELNVAEDVLPFVAALNGNDSVALTDEELHAILAGLDRPLADATRGQRRLRRIASVLKAYPTRDRLLSAFQAIGAAAVATGATEGDLVRARLRAVVNAAAAYALPPPVLPANEVPWE